MLKRRIATAVVLLGVLLAALALGPLALAVVLALLIGAAAFAATRKPPRRLAARAQQPTRGGPAPAQPAGPPATPPRWRCDVSALTRPLQSAQTVTAAGDLTHAPPPPARR